MFHKLILPFIIFSLLLTSCDEDVSKRTLPNSTGSSGELIIVVDTAYVNNRTGDALETVFMEELYGVPRSEPLFNVVTVPPKGFTSMLKVVRNILQIDINAANKPEIKVQNDVFSKDQLIITIAAKTDQSASNILIKNKEKLQQLFNQEEVKRTKNRLLKNVEKEKQKSLLTKHGHTVAFPKEYFLSMDSADFFFIRKNKEVGEHQILQGLMVYSYPYLSDSDFVATSIVQNMERFTQNIVSQPKGFMQVERQYPVLSDEVNFNGNYAMELSGLWRMEGIFMGGSFFNYTFSNTDNSKLIGIYGFVYAPKFDHREYLRELKALAYTFTEGDGK
tara:strand:+ start:625 stop:1623 length:999 start_codon:yes stop_codon:yes gene_type:complete